MPPVMGVDAVAFLKERFEKDLKHFRVYDNYTHDLKSKFFNDSFYNLRLVIFIETLLTSKFYSKYEGPSNDIPDPDLMEKIKKVKYDTPKQRHAWPSTENQWF